MLFCYDPRTDNKITKFVVATDPLADAVFRTEYKYVLNERILGLAHDDKPQIGDRDGKTESMKMIIDKGLKLDSQEPKESSDMGEQNPSKIRII